MKPRDHGDEVVNITEMLLNKLNIVAEHEIRESPFLSAQLHMDHAASV